jgi:hypothetical protein
MVGNFLFPVPCSMVLPGGNYTPAASFDQALRIVPLQYTVQGIMGYIDLFIGCLLPVQYILS